MTRLESLDIAMIRLVVEGVSLVIVMIRLVRGLGRLMIGMKRLGNGLPIGMSRDVIRSRLSANLAPEAWGEVY